MKLQPPTLAEKTRYGKRHKISVFLDHLENQEIFNLDNFEIEIVYSFIASLPYAPQTVSNFKFVIREFFNILYSKKISSVDGNRIFPVISTKKRNRIASYYKDEEVQRMINAIDITQPYGVRDKCMVLLAAQMGLREADIIQLSFDEILWDKSLISKKQQKTGHVVTIPLPQNLKLLLLDYIKSYRPSSNEKFVFICPKTHKRYSPSIVHYIVSKYLLAAGICTSNRKHGPHALRHSLASSLLKNNAPMPVITGILGHKNLNTTSRYLSIDVESLRRCCLEVPSE